jgi:phosphate acyltransferase
MKIGVDIFGGDFAPDTIIRGAIQARQQLPPEIQLVLIGNQEDIERVCQSEKFDPSHFEALHTTEYITMGEHPAKAFASKPGSSIVQGFGLLKKGLIDGLASAGNTGAMLVGVIQMIKVIPGVIRPCIAATVPSNNGYPTVLLDVGINPDSKPDVLYQYGLLGSIYARRVYNIPNPKVGLMNIGEEDEKGNLTTKAAHQAMKGTKEFNFIGNVEGTDLFNSDRVNVIVCDGFVGNVILKQVEAFYDLTKKRGLQDEYFEKLNFENYGGLPILGASAPVVIGHGKSKETAIKNMIILTSEVVEANIIDTFKEKFI